MNTKLNKSDFTLLGCYFLVSIAMETRVYYYYKKALLREYFIDFPVEIFSICSLIIIFIHWLIPKYFVQEKKYFHFLFFALLSMIVIGVFDYVICFASGKEDWSKFPSLFDLILYAIVGCSRMTGLPFALVLTKKLYEGQIEYLKMEKLQKENELKLLRSQLDPHFLFNNLNTLDALVDTNPLKAKEYINRLSSIYRYLIQTKDSEVMELSKELNLAENYIFLIKTRFGADYSFIIEKNTPINDKFIPTGTIQTLLENVVKHNKVLDGETINTKILVDKSSMIIINEKSKEKSSNTSFSTGLENLETRYRLLTDKKVLIKNTENNFSVQIPIINLDV